MKRRKRKHHSTRAKLRLENLERRDLLAADFAPTRNAIDPVDVDGNGQAELADALMTVNAIQSRGRGEQPGGADFDVNGDGEITLADAMAIINTMQERQRRGGGRGPGPDGPPSNGGGGGTDESLEVRSIDGTGNNETNPELGSAGVELLRSTEVEYEDGISTPAGEDRASAREISNLVSAQDESVVNERGLTDLLWQWGQFLDHDIDLTENADPEEAFDIEVPTGDALFDPFSTGTQTIDLNRSIYNEETGDSTDDPRQQINQITAFIDGSMVYGSDDERALALRTLEGGRLKTSEGDLLPFNEDGLENAGGTSDTLFVAGDVRANEQAGLTAMHTLWVREHNRVADRIAAENPELSDEEIYQQARAIVIGEIQAITFNEFLPALLGEDAIGEYQGYDASVNPGISNVFSTAAYRFGHTMLSSELLRLDTNGEVIEDGNLALRDAFFNPANITDYGIDSLLRGLASQEAQEIDTLLVDDVRNFLFGPPGSGGFDLASLNIQRGRDHGLADYNQVRVDYGLTPVESFADITSDVALQQSLAEAYDGDVNNIDAWVGILAEDHVAGGSLGETGAAVLVDQFTRLRDGDRLWYENTFSGEQLRRIDNTTLADVIERNTDVEGLQQNVFFAADAQPIDDGRPDVGEDRPDRGNGQDNAQPRRSAQDLFAETADELFGQLGLGRDPLA